LIVILLANVIAYGGMVAIHWQYGTLRNGYTPITLAWYALAFIAYLSTLVWAEFNRGLPRTIIWSGAIIFRVMLLFTTPTLSDDVYRYMWDGYVANNGVSPYAYPINSPALDYLDTPQRALANNAWMASPYLPAAQYLFAALTRFFPPTPLAFQVAMVFIDLLNGFLLVKLLRIVGLPEFRVLIYLWNPLVIVEIAHSAHIDSWMILLALLAIWFTFAPNPRKLFTYFAPITLALSTLTKGLPIVFLPVLFWRWQWWQLGLYGLTTVGLLLPAGLTAGWGLSGPLDGTGVFGALRIYSTQWNFNSGFFHAVEVTLTNWGVTPAEARAKLIVGILMGLVILAVWYKARSAETAREYLQLMTAPLIAYLLLTPTVHPWYLLLLLALVPFLSPLPGESLWRWLTVAPWVYLSGALALSYLTYLDPQDFRELEWVRRIEWWPTWILLMIGATSTTISHLIRTENHQKSEFDRCF
jgi:hypothetical protein